LSGGNLKRHSSLIFACLVTAVAAFICIRIEVFNCQAGGLLPSKELRDTGEPATWREASIVRARMEERFLAEANAAGSPAVLTRSQRQEIDQAARKADLNNRFLAFVSTWGLAQYVLAPLAMLLSLGEAVLRRETRRYRQAACVPAGVALLCIILMFYRGYFSSLGW